MNNKDIQKIRATYQYAQRKAARIDKSFYSLRSILGNTWAYFYILIGGREAGKSYSVMDLFLRDWKKKKKPFTWIRLNEKSTQKMLANKADKLIDPDLRRKYDLELTVNTNQVFDHGEPMCKVLALSTFYNDKGVALYDNEFDLGYNIAVDEFQPEPTAQKNLFDTAYALVNQLENLVRSSKENIRIFLICNLLEEASDILVSFGFIPEIFGRYYIHKKRAVIDYIPPSESYLKRRKGTIADLLSSDSSTFTNRIEVDKSLICKNQLLRPTYTIKFTKDKSDWFTVWDGVVVKQYNGENLKAVPMRPYLDEVFSTELRDSIIANFDNKYFLYRDLFTQKSFKRQLELLKPRKG